MFRGVGAALGINLCCNSEMWYVTAAPITRWNRWVSNVLPSLQGLFNLDRIGTMMFQNVLMVCTGNICRSPYAEYALAAKASHIHVSSAGLSVPADEGATHPKVAHERGVDMTPHVAQSA